MHTFSIILVIVVAVIVIAEYLLGGTMKRAAYGFAVVTVCLGMFAYELKEARFGQAWFFLAAGAINVGCATWYALRYLKGELP